jgi:hypothetical protein
MLFTTQEANQVTIPEEEETKPPVVDEIAPRRVRLKHTGRLGSDSLALYIEHNTDPLIIQLIHEAILGRYSPGNGTQPRVDLAPYDAQTKGVSRLHAAIRRGSDGRMNIVDLGSSNGTWLNGGRLDAQRPYVLHPGDRVILSQIQIEIYFDDARTGTAISGT